MAIANYEDRFVIPSTHREYAENAFNVRGGCGFSFGNGCSEGGKREPLRRREEAHHSHQGAGLTWHAHDHLSAAGRRPPGAARCACWLRCSATPTRERGHLPEMTELLPGRRAFATRLGEIEALTRWLSGGRARGRNRIRRDFDRGRATSLHLFEHVHGDSRDRGRR